jgi:hypothetical protein
VRVSGTDVTVECHGCPTPAGAAGREVAQLYVGDPEAAVRRPPRELKGLRGGGELGPGEQRRITFALHARDLSYWSTHPSAGGCWRAASSRSRSAHPRATSDNRPRSPSAAAAATPAAHRRSSLDEWLADADGAARLREAAGAAAILGDAELRRVIGNFPLGRLAAFPRWGSPTTCCGGSAWCDAQPLTRSTRGVQLRERGPLARLSISRSRRATTRSLNDDSPERGPSGIGRCTERRRRPSA